MTFAGTDKPPVGCVNSLGTPPGAVPALNYFEEYTSDVPSTAKTIANISETRETSTWHNGYYATLYGNRPLDIHPATL